MNVNVDAVLDLAQARGPAFAQRVGDELARCRADEFVHATIFDASTSPRVERIRFANFACEVATSDGERFGPLKRWTHRWLVIVSPIGNVGLKLETRLSAS